MIARRRRDNSALAFVFSQVANFVVCAAKFESSGVLHIFGLEKNLVAAKLRKKIARYKFRLLDNARQLFICAVNVSYRRALHNLGR